MTFRTAVVLLAAGLASSAMAETRWEMPTPYAASTFQTKNIIQFVADVEKATNGSLIITVHTNGSLIKHPDIKRAVSQNRVSIGEMLISLAADEAPIYGLDTVPFLATNYDEARKLYAAQRPFLEKKLAEEGMMLLFSVPWPPQGIYTRSEIKRLSDLKGLKVSRTQNAMARRIAAIAGSTPTNIETPDLADAIAKGQVDVVTSISSDADVPDAHFLSHYLNAKIWLPRNMVFVNKAAFDALTSGEKTALVDAAKTAEARGWKASEVEAAARTKILVDNNVEVVDPSTALKNDFDTLISPVLTKEWLNSAGTDGQTILKSSPEVTCVSV